MLELKCQHQPTCLIINLFLYIFNPFKGKLKNKLISNIKLIQIKWDDIFMILATKGFGVKVVGPSKWNFGFQWPDRAGPKMANP